MTYLIILALAQVFITIYLLWSDFRNKKAERFLLLYIIILGVYLITKFISQEFYSNHNILKELSTPLSLAGGPLIFFYVMYKTKKKFTDAMVAVHFIPLAIFSVLFVAGLIYFQIKNDSSLYNWYYRYKGLFAFVSVLGYCIYLLIYLEKSSKKIKKMQWFKIPLWLMIIPPIAVVIPYILLKRESEIFRYVNLVSIFFILMLIIGHYYKKQRKKALKDNIVYGSNKPVYKKSGLTSDNSNIIIEEILKMMEEKKMFLNPDLKLEELAIKMGVPKHHITEALNVNLNKTFYQLINEYRVAAVKEKIKNSSSKDNLLFLAYDCGFNSKTTFFKYFKMIEGLTPSQYRKQQIL